MFFFHPVAVDGALAVGGIHTDENAVDFFDVVIVGALKFPFLLAGHDAAHIVQRPLQYVVTKGGGFLCFLGFHINDKGDKVTGFRGFGVEKDVKSDPAFGGARFLIPVALNLFRDGIGLVLVQWNPADFRCSFDVDIGNIFYGSILEFGNRAFQNVSQYGFVGKNILGALVISGLAVTHEQVFCSVHFPHHLLLYLFYHSLKSLFFRRVFFPAGYSGSVSRQ